MNKNWSSYGNSYLRYLESPRKLGDSMIMSMQSASELQLGLEAILMFVKHMKCTEDVIIKITTNGKGGTIRYSRSVSEEMC